jgi:tight adherence protein C
MSGSSWGALLGLCVGVATWSCLSWWRAYRPLPLLDRVGPYLGPGVARVPTVIDPTVSLSTLLWRAGRRRSDDPTLASKLRRAGRPLDLSAYRVERLAWAGVAASLGVLVGLVLVAGGGASLAPAVLGGTCAVAGWWACDERVRRQGRQRQEAMASQVPLLADLVALAVTAGATPVSALQSAAAAVPGPLADEVAQAVAAIRAGDPAEAALQELTQHLGIPGLRRLVDSLLVAVEHGAPLAHVARAQAEDLRADDRRRLMEAAGRRDVAMLVPIVFLVLPSVVVIALFPAAQSLRLVVP